MFSNVQIFRFVGKKKTTDAVVDKSTEFDALMNSINKQYGDNSIIRIGEDKIAPIPIRGSGSVLLDSILGGGYPKGRFIEIIGAESSGKAQPLSEPIITPSGYRTMGSMKVGTKVLTPDGNVTEVDGVYPQGVQDTYIIDFEDGSHVRTTLDHLFTVYEDQSGTEVTLTVKELMGAHNRFYVKPTAPLVFSTGVNLSLSEKYVLGVIRGDLRHNPYLNYLLGNLEERKALIDLILSNIPKVTPTKYIAGTTDIKAMLVFLVKSVGERLVVKRFNSDKYEITLLKDQPFKNYIRDIYFDKREECQCIKVAHPSHQYITRDVIPTHNTTLALSAIAEAQKNGEQSAFIDMEHALNLNYAEQLGVNVKNLYFSQPSYAEEALNIAERLIESGLFAYVVIDSVASLVPKKELEGESGDAVMGLQARLMSQACRKLTGISAKTDTTVLFINQLRHKIGVFYGNPEVTTGGNALRFYASQRLQIYKGQSITDTSGGVIGHNLRVKVIKNKVAPPFKEATTELIYGQGFNKVTELVNVAISQGIIQKAGSWYKYGDTSLGQGFDKAVELITDNPELLAEIQNLVHF